MRRTLHSRPGSDRKKSGAALLLSLLILVVLVAIVIQINVGTGTDARIARNDVGLTSMDLAIESALLQVDDQLAMDGENAAEGVPGGAEGAPGGAPPAQPAGQPAGGAPGQGGQAATDSRKDEWARPQRTTINEIRLRILVQDEDSKINVLGMLDPDEKEAEAIFDRVVRCLDLCREGTEADVEPSQAERMARAMLEYMKDRAQSNIPRPKLLSDDPSKEDQGLPMSLKEFAALPPFEESHFRDFRDEDGEIVHSIGSFLTVWSSIATSADAARNAKGGAGGAAGGTSGGTPPAQTPPTPGGAQGPAGGAGGGTPAPSGRVDTGGYAVNVNTAPIAVLKSLFEDRDLHPRFWDNVLEYRNLEEEKPEDEEADAEPPLDEFGEPIIDRQIFDTLGELSEVVGWSDVPADAQARLNQLLTTQSRVFSIFIVARRSTAAEGDATEEFGTAEELEERERAGDALVRVVRCVVWRHQVDGSVVITPLVRWEVIDYAPYEVRDYREERH